MDINSISWDSTLLKVQFSNEKEVLNQCIHRWEFKRLESRERQLRDILSLADEENKESIDRLTIELMEIQKEMKAHGGKM